MDQEIKELLEENLEISRENNKLLKKLWGSVRLGRLMRILYFSLAVALAVGAYYYVHPYLQSLLGLYSSLNKVMPEAQNLPVQSLLDAFAQ